MVTTSGLSPFTCPTLWCPRIVQSRSSLSWVSVHACVYMCAHFHTLCSSICLRLPCTTLLNLGLALIKLPLYSHLWCTEVVKGELTRQLQPSSCGRSVVTHITLQYYVVPPSVDWCCVSVSTTALSSGGEGFPSLIAHGSSHHASFSRVLRDAPKRCTLFDKLQRSVKYTYVCSSKCVCLGLHTHACVFCEKDFCIFVLFLHRLWATSNTLVSRHWACNWSWGKDAKGRGQKKVLAYAMVADDPWKDNVPILCSLLDSHLY